MPANSTTVVGVPLLTKDHMGEAAEDAKATKSYRDPIKMKALTDFWEIYFKKSKAQVIEIGQPALLNPIH